MSASGRAAPRVAVLDYGAGNLRSAARALQLAGAEPEVTDRADRAERADALVVPGVGHFGQCVDAFRTAGLEGMLRDWVAADRPALGVCVGMQILYPSSEEAPGAEGLGLLPGRVRRLPAGTRVPHMGWSPVQAVADEPLLAGLDGERFYFVHSYVVEPAGGHGADGVVATCPHGPGFPAVVRRGALVATQFHPEKSGEAGRRLLTAFVAEVVDRAGVGGPAGAGAGR